MDRPKISKKEAKIYLDKSVENITAALSNYVSNGRLSRFEADRYLVTATKNPGLPLYVIAIRGYYKNSKGKPLVNDRGIYDDAAILIAPDYLVSFNSNCDPRVYEKGKAMLLPGWHLFKQGFHGYGKPSGHQAFRTANAKEILPVLRDGEIGIKDGHTINLHSGGYNNTNSAGCQTIFKGQWQEFVSEAYRLMGVYKQDYLPYLLLEQ